MNDLEKAVYQLVSKIPRGKVLTYGMIAKATGIKNPRYVGRILHNNPDPANIPCHRVVRSSGEVAANFAFGGMLAQTHKLEQENVLFRKNRVDLKNCLHNFS